ncbi:MAG: P-II family nitrogen regulator [Gammaproteobacteria bacterium]|nr:MAG: P-II family nitrogen regulator [Gammaproteobacteria bacterium]RKZ71400.1 MAG: P-II family nitrogen regulator [Gammaproteobacteria bacterium]
MKLIIAYIKENMFEKVSLALHKIDGLTGISYSKYNGLGRSRGGTESEPRQDDGYEYLPCIKLEIACNDDLVDTIVREIRTNAHTGLRRDGKIYVLPVDEAVRIGTGETGRDAI